MLVFSEKIGSNFRIADRTLVLDFKNAFKIAEKYHAEALCAEAVSYDFTKSENWRRGWDLNPRGACAPTGFRNQRNQPGYATSPYKIILPYLDLFFNLFFDILM